jgi:predicted DNA-binding protein (MmcQ/YjbR family)
VRPRRPDPSAGNFPTVARRVARRVDPRDTPVMTRALVNAWCATLPGAEVSDPWGGGHDAWKIGGRMFAVVGTADDGVSVKCRDVETAALLIEVGRAARAPYFHRSWVRVPWGLVPDDELRDRLTESYRLIRAGLTKKAQAALPPLPTSAPDPSTKN